MKIKTYARIVLAGGILAGVVIGNILKLPTAEYSSYLVKVAQDPDCIKYPNTSLCKVKFDGKEQSFNWSYFGIISISAIICFFFLDSLATISTQIETLNEDKKVKSNAK